MINNKIVYIKGLKVIIYIVFLSLKIIFVLSHSVDSGEMLHYAAFHLSLHSLPKYTIRIH